MNNSNTGANSKLNIDFINIIIFVLLSLFFFGIYLIYGTPVYNDSDQYIAMHVHREPVYPLFLYVIRCITPAGFMSVASILQSVLCIYASFRFVTYVRKTFELKIPETAVCTLIVITPYIITPVFSKLHIQMSVAIMSESIAIPVFLLFIINLHSSFVKCKFKNMLISFVISLVLTLIRSQMIFTFILWFIMAVIMVFMRRSDESDDTLADEKILPEESFGNKVYHDNVAAKISPAACRVMWLIVCVILLISGFTLRDVSTRAYNYVFNGRYVDSVYSHINLLANILYVSDRTDLDDCEDEHLREIFLEIYDKADSQGYLYNSAGSSLSERVGYLEEVHDRIKYDCIEYGLRDIVEEETGIHDYIEYNRIADGYAGDMIKALLPKIFGKWAADAFLLGTRGLVRNIAVCHPVMYIYVAFILLIAVWSVIYMLRKDIRDKSAWFMIIALLAVFGNSYSTAIVIMCLSRYMIYGFPIIYTALLISGKKAVSLTLK